MGAERDFSFSSFLRLATRQQHTIIAMIKANSATPAPTDTAIIVPVVQKPERMYEFAIALHNMLNRR